MPLQCRSNRPQVSYHQKHIFIVMSYSLSFPPVDAVVHKVREVDYHRVLSQFVILTASIAAVIVSVSQFLYNSAAQWYQQSGRNLVLHSITQIHSITSSLLTLTYDKIAEE
jgi:hypothetical protein